MKTVVTRAVGFIGGNLFRRLIQLERDIKYVDNVSRGKSWRFWRMAVRQ